MISGVWFSAELKCQNMEFLLERLHEMVPSVAEGVEAHDCGYIVRFAGGEAKLLFSGKLLWIEIEAEDATLCMGIRSALATALIEHLVDPPMSILFPERGE